MTRLKRLIMPMLVFASLAVGAVATSACLNYGEAHAAARLALAEQVAAQPTAAIDWGFWFEALLAVGTAASLLLHFIAPRTKNTIDDRLRDDIDEVLAFVRASKLPGKPSALTVATPPSASQAGGAQ